MADATNTQIQNYVDQRVRPRAEQIRALLNAIQDDINTIGDVYQALATDNNPNNWVDNRPDGPPHLLTAADVLAWNTFIHDLVTAINNDAQLPVIQKACVRSL